MDLRNRIAALEAAAERGRPEYADPDYAYALNLALIERRVIPLPPMDGVNIEATARHWTRVGEGRSREFVMTDGRIATVAELIP